MGTVGSAGHGSAFPYLRGEIIWDVSQNLRGRFCRIASLRSDFPRTVPEIHVPLEPYAQIKERTVTAALSFLFLLNTI